MRRRFYPWMLLAILACTSLACELVNSATDPGPLRVESVDVSPAEGNGTFTASVGLPAHQSDGTLSCYIPDESSGGQKSVYQQTVPALRSSRILTFEFTMTEPGSYKLYCTAMEIGITAKTTFTVVAAAVTPAPTNPPTTPAGGQPLQFSGTGQKTDYSGDYSCAVGADVRLVVNPDGTAELVVIGPGFNDHINCTQSGSMDGWYLAGTANPADETVTLVSCNNGGFNAQGTISYAGGTLSGDATCIYNQGSSSGKVAMKITTP